MLVMLIIFVSSAGTTIVMLIVCVSSAGTTIVHFRPKWLESRAVICGRVISDKW